MIKGHLSTVPGAQFRKSVLHFAPEKSLRIALSDRGLNPDYHCYDLAPETYRSAAAVIRRHDLTDTQSNQTLPKADIIVHNHVLEHLAGDFRQAIRDLNRALKPGGIHLFTIPFRKGRLDEDLDPGLSGEQREVRFGQRDHMRLFGTDDTILMLEKLMDRTDVVFPLSSYLTVEQANALGIGRAYDADARGKIRGSVVFYYQASGAGATQHAVHG